MQKKYKVLRKLTCFSFIILGTFPLMKENINSITIVVAAFFVFLNIILSKKKVYLSKELLLFTLLFWMFFFHELITLDLSFKRILLYLPFLIFPLLFCFKPNYIGNRIRNISLTVFHLSVFLTSSLYFWEFLSEHSFEQMFFIDQYNVPFFRDFIFRNSFLNVHPTYFSSFLLVSFTISGYTILKNKLSFKFLVAHLLNILFTAFMIFLFGSRIIIVILFISTLILLVLFLKKFKKKKVWMYSVIIGAFVLATIVPFRQLLSQRFIEVVTEYKKPVKGNYHNSTNIRVAILQCSLVLMRDLPFLGYGDGLQQELNTCYEKSFESNFAKNNNYNTHNYYINLLLYGGWVFLILFIGYIMGLVIKTKKLTLITILLIQFMIINLTENYLSRHYGIVTYNYFICLLYFCDKKKE